MTAGPAIAGCAGRSRHVLVLDRSAAVLDAVTRELTELGIAAEGSARAAVAAEEFDPVRFDLLAIGGGVDAAVRNAVAQAFIGRNPAIRVLDTQSSAAVRQIAAALDGRAVAPAVDLDRYAARIGFEASWAPSLPVLRSLQELHPSAIPFEAIDVLLGRGIDLTPAAVDAKLIGARRGGYCFEQNGLFRRVLAAAGFAATGLMARVLWNLPAGSAPQPRTHMVLRVDLEGVPWLVDVGFGSVVPTEPLRLDSEEPQETRHETFRIIGFGTELLLQVRREGRWLPVYLISRDSVHDADYEAANWYTATHPSSHFARNLIVARTTPDMRATLLGNRLTLRWPGGDSERRELDASGIEQALHETFGLPVAADWLPLVRQAAASR